MELSFVTYPFLMRTKVAECGKVRMGEYVSQSRQCFCILIIQEDCKNKGQRLLAGIVAAKVAGNTAPHSNARQDELI